MEPWEIMISESQERMVAVVRPQMLDAVRAVCARWELPCTPIGEVTDARRAARVLGRRGRRLDPGAPADRRVPALRGRAGEARRLAGGAEAAERREPRRQDAGSTSSTTSSSARAPCAGPGSTPACCGCGRRCAASPSRSRARGPASATRSARASQAVLGAARNVACAGGEPIGLTDCLNFGNPEKPEIAYELAQAIEGIAQAAEALGIPVVSGQRLALQRHRRPLDPADAGRRLRRPRRRTCGSCRAAGSRATSCCSPQAPEDEPRRRGGARSGSSGRPRRSSRSATTSATAASSTRSPRRRAGAAARRTSSCRPSRRAARRSSPRPATRSRGSARGASSRSDGCADVRRLRRLRRPTATSRGSRTSGSSRCSTAARSRRASPSPSRAA